MGRRLPGKDLSSLLAASEKASNTAVRDGALYCYNMFAYIDGAFMAKAVAALQQPDGKARPPRRCTTSETYRGCRVTAVELRQVRQAT
jgi:hypothetical protein